MNTILQKRIEEVAEQYSVSWRKNPDGSESKEMFPVAAERCFKAGATFALQNQWISVEEGLPLEYNKQTGQTIEVFAKSDYGNVFIAYYDYSNGLWYHTNEAIYDKQIYSKITHWMEIPSLEGGER